MEDFESNWQNSMGGHLDYHEALNGPAGGGEGDGPTYDAPKGYKPSTVDQRKRWNQFLDFLDKKGVGGSKDLDARDRSLGKKYLQEYNKTNPDAAVSEDFVPTAQYESYLIRKKNQFPGLSEDQSKYAFANLPAAYHNRPISSVDSWLGSATSKQYYPTFESRTKEGKQDFGTSFEDYLKHANIAPGAVAENK